MLNSTKCTHQYIQDTSAHLGERYSTSQKYSLKGAIFSLLLHVLLLQLLFKAHKINSKLPLLTADQCSHTVTVTQGAFKREREPGMTGKGEGSLIQATASAEKKKVRFSNQISKLDKLCSDSSSFVIRAYEKQCFIQPFFLNSSVQVN